MSLVKQHIGVEDGVAERGRALSARAEHRWPFGYESIEFVTILSDALTILLVSVVSSAAYHLHVSGDVGGLSKPVGAAIVVAALFVLWMKCGGFYAPAALLSLRKQVAGICFTWAGICVLLGAAVAALGLGASVSRPAGALFAASGLGALLLHRAVWKGLLSWGATNGRYSGRKVVLITDHSQPGAPSLPAALSSLGFRLERHFTLPPSGSSSSEREETIARVIACVRGSDVEEIMVGADPISWPNMQRLVTELRVLPFPVSFIPVGPGADVFKRRSRVLGSSVCIELQRGPLSPLECALKRALDVTVAGTALVLLSPLLLLVAAAIKLESSGPVLFRQRRCGFNGRQFQILKFRTMTVLEDGGAVRQAQQADARVTRVGRWLRRTSIDELLQLLNVLEGSMSLVGPRPHAIAHDVEFDKVVRNYAFRQRVKPGLTGWAQVNGCRGPTPTPESIQRRVRYDLWYIDHWSLRLDFMILLQTAVEVVRGRNAY